MRIITAEDSPTQAETLKFILEELGFEASIAMNGKEAFELIELDEPDLVISDIMMPEMDGFELCRNIKSHEKYKELPVILLTSLSDSADVVKGLKAGADNFISKPIDEELLGKVIEMVGNGKSKVLGSESDSDKDKLYQALLTTYETAILRNKSLMQAQKELNDLNKSLESIVKSRTMELAKEVEVRKKAEQAIRESERIIKEITENVSDLVFKTDLEGIYQWVNPAHYQLLGYQSGALLGNSLFEFIHPEDQENIIQLFRNNKDEGQSFNIEYQYLHAEGHYVWMECSANIIYNGYNQPASIVFAAHGITERKYFEKELIEGRDKARKSDSLKSSFLANMSHDIRTPMNAIIGFTELLKDDDITNQEKAKYLGQISKNGESLLNLVNDIIDVSKIEASVLRIHKTSCPINDICTELYEFYKPQVEVRSSNKVALNLSKGWDDANQYVFNDPLRFRQILSNLLSNALKFTKKGSIDFGYEIKDEENILFYVRDSGIGIPGEDHELIFDQFFRSNSTIDQNQGGTGLGLAISQNLCSLMGGKMWVESKVGSGSCFYFTLPNEKVKNVEETRKGEERIVKLPDLSSKKILIVEDDQSSYIFLEAVLRRSKATIIWADDGLKAVQFCKDYPDIDLVLMDIQVPKLSGYDATMLIKEIRPNLPVVAQTAFSMSGEEQKCYEAGCDNYLSKPILPKDLIKMVCKYMVPELG